MINFYLYEDKDVTLLSKQKSTLCCCLFQKSLEGQHSFEQKLHFMLQRIGVSKAQQGEAQVCECPDLDE